MRRIFGVLMLVLGAVLTCWIAYNLLIERQPTATGSPLPAMVFCAGLIYVGTKWVRGETA